MDIVEKLSKRADLHGMGPDAHLFRAAAAEFVRMRAAELNYQAAHDLQEAKIGRLRAENVELKAAIVPLAQIPLWRDHYPDAKQDHVSKPNACRLTAEQIRRARDALEQEGPSK